MNGRGAVNDKPLRILVVDDEPQIRRFLRTSLSAHGYHMIEAACGKEAMVLTTTEHPDVLMLDLGLPDIDGLEVVRRIREWSNVPIIVLSVRGREEDKIAALDGGPTIMSPSPSAWGSYWLESARRCGIGCNRRWKSHSSAAPG